jgi:hypothetical protein
MINSTSTKFAEELFGPEVLQVCDEERPEVKDVVPGEAVTFLHQYHLTAQEGRLDRCPQTARPRPNHQYLQEINTIKFISQGPAPITWT